MDLTFYSQFWPAFVATVVGGITLAAFFFVLKEWLFSLPSLTGVWECEQITAMSANNPFIGMKVTYHVVLLQAKDKLVGDGEKDREDGANGKIDHSGKGRVRINVQGGVEKFITKSDRVTIHWMENGARITSTIHNLRISGSKNSGKLFGQFYSTAGKSAGTATWTRISSG